MDVRTRPEQRPAVQSGPHVVITREPSATVRVRATASELLPRLLLARVGFQFLTGARLQLPPGLGVVGEIHRIARAVRSLEAADFTVRHPLGLPVTGPQRVGVCAKCRADLYVDGITITDTWNTLYCVNTDKIYIPHVLQEV